jgi:hypothetical protein
MNTRRIARTVAAAALLALLAGCGQGLSGEYGTTNSRGEFEPVMTFKSGGEVETELMGNIMVGKYEVKDGKVYISPVEGGPVQALRIDDKGCIDGGMVFGTLCKKH